VQGLSGADIQESGESNEARGSQSNMGNVKENQLLGLIRCSEVILHDCDKLEEKEKATQGNPSGNHKPNVPSEIYEAPENEHMDIIANGDAMAVQD
jgi:hypothetical protein